MSTPTRDLGERREDEGVAFDLVPRQLQARLVDDEVTVEQQIDVHRPRCETPTAAPASAGRLDPAQALGEVADGLVGLETDDEIVEVVAFEADGVGLVDRGQDEGAIPGGQGLADGPQLPFTVDIAADAQIDLGHRRPGLALPSADLVSCAICPANGPQALDLGTRPVMPLFIAIALLIAAPPEDGDRWYDVELIVFARQPGQVEEVWPRDPGTPDLSDTVALPARNPAASTPRFPFQPLPAARERLRAALHRLETQPDIEVLGHLAWRQPAIARGLAPAVHIHLPPRPAGSDNEAIPPTATDAPVDDPNTDGPDIDDTDRDVARIDDEQALPAPSIDGRFLLSLNHYLHIDLDLLYDSTGTAGEAAVIDGSTPPPSGQDGQAPAGPAMPMGDDRPSDDGDAAGAAGMEAVARYYRMRQSRRIRIGRLHYFDHPYIGLLVLVERDEEGASADGD